MQHADKFEVSGEYDNFYYISNWCEKEYEVVGYHSIFC